jgi:hypothetical protein
MTRHAHAICEHKINSNGDLTLLVGRRVNTKSVFQANEELE